MAISSMSRHRRQTGDGIIYRVAPGNGEVAPFSLLAHTACSACSIPLD
jgi:hypothetical protein